MTADRMNSVLIKEVKLGNRVFFNFIAAGTILTVAHGGWVKVPLECTSGNA